MFRLWVGIKDFNGYAVSNDGCIYSYHWKRRMSPKKHSCGYRFVVLCRGKERVAKYVHRLVAEAFIPNPNNLPEVNHKDEDKTNCCVSNLEWCDRYYNMNYGTLWERRAANYNETIRKRRD